MITQVFLLISGLVLLIVGSNYLLKSAVDLSIKLNLSKVVIGLTVVSFATSAPELLISLSSALKGSADIAISNVIGSNIANLGLVLGTVLCFTNIKIPKSNIKFENVSFQYESGKERAIKNISIDIEGEKITALVGHSGAGKSTILNLIPRFYEPQEGKIFLDKQEINKVSLKSLRDKISLVSQDVILFDDSVENNIKYAKLDATEQEVKNACKLAAADEFIDTLSAPNFNLASISLIELILPPTVIGMKVSFETSSIISRNDCLLG